MATSVFKHNEDKGDLSVFASGDEILFACSKGHWWIVDAKESGRDVPDSTRDGRRERLDDLADDSPRLRDLTSRFGPDVLRAMKQD